MAAQRAAVRAAVLGAVALLAVLLGLTCVNGQGYVPSPHLELGTSSRASQQLAAQLMRTRAFRAAWRRGGAARRASCNALTPLPGEFTSLCGPKPGPNRTHSETYDDYAALMLATSPAVYASTNTTDTGGLRLVAPAEDQWMCNTCTAFVAVAAGRMAVAAALNTHVDAVPALSAHDLHFCGAARLTCMSSSSLPVALQQLKDRRLRTAACLPYDPIYRPDDKRDVCEGRCNNTAPQAAQGNFVYERVNNMWEAQLQIRQHGVVISSFQVFDDLRPFFSKNPRGVYKPKQGAKFVEWHAVLLVGYDSNAGAWLTQTSWGPDFADGGLFRVKYDSCGILAEAYTVQWRPNKPVAPALDLRVPAPNMPGCFEYKAQAGDYLSRVALRAGVKLEQLLIDNMDSLQDLETPLAGRTLLVCKAGARSPLPPATASSPPALPDSARIKPALEWKAEGFQYRLYDRMLPHDKAEAFCASLGGGGGHLASITSIEEYVLTSSCLLSAKPSVFAKAPAHLVGCGGEGQDNMVRSVWLGLRRTNTNRLAESSSWGDVLKASAWTDARPTSFLAARPGAYFAPPRRVRDDEACVAMTFCPRQTSAAKLDMMPCTLATPFVCKQPLADASALARPAASNAR